jgi:outer membrane cobalamin receptor
MKLISTTQHINMINKIKFPFIVFLLLISAQISMGQTGAEDTTDITTMSLEQLMQYKSQGVPSLMDSKIAAAIDVASSKPLAIRNSPAILSVITAEEIEHSGARDLMDILNTVPGLDFATDVEGVVGIGIRGNWAHEGKALLLLDGHELNETVYGSLQFGNGFPIDNIKRIEIIRGSRSAIYGGMAEYAVINIISKNETDGNRVSLTTSYGSTEKTMSHNNYSLSAAKKINGFGIHGNAFWGTSIRSDRPYSDIYNSSYDMAQNSKLNSLNFNLGVSYKNLSVTALYLNNSEQTRDGYEQVLQTAYKEYFRTLSIEAKYMFRPSKKISILPKLSFKHHSPWEVSAIAGNNSAEMYEVAYKTEADRYKLNVTSVYDPGKNLNLTFGGEGFYDIAYKFGEDVFRNSNKQKVSYQNAAGFAQAIFKNRITDLIIGARYDYNNSFGSAFVPRVGLTKRIKKFNFKLLYSNSFKAPVIENVETSLLNKISPEKTQTSEFEIGYQVHKNMFLSLNLFDMTTKNTIIYYVDTSANNNEVPDGYLNTDITGSQGIEFEYKIIEEWGNVYIGYSFYTKANKPKMSYYQNPNDESQALGFANNKLSVNTTFNITKTFYISPSLIYKSGKTGITGINSDLEYTYTQLPETYDLNLFIGKNNFLTKNLNASIGAYNLLNEKTLFVQPYAGGHAPLPGLSREFLVRLSYKLQ